MFARRESEQNAPRFCKNHAGTSKTSRVFAEITSGQAKRPAFLRKMRQDEQNAPRFHKNCVKTTKTPRQNPKRGLGAATRRSAMRCFLRKLAYWKSVGASFGTSLRLVPKLVKQGFALRRFPFPKSSPASQAGRKTRGKTPCANSSVMRGGHFHADCHRFRTQSAITTLQCRKKLIPHSPLPRMALQNDIRFSIF